MEMDIDTETNGGLEGASRVRDHKQAVDEWDKFLALCILRRLDPEPFETYVSVLHSKHPLPPAAVADVFLKPQPANRESLDPRVPRYIQVLSEQKLIDTPSILKALYKHSTSHTQAQAVGHAEAEVAQDNPDARWKSSYGQEETIFYRLTKSVALGTGIKSFGDAVAVCKIVARWMILFTSAATAFAQDIMGQVHSAQAKEDMEASRAAFVMMLLRVCENATVLKALSTLSAKGEMDLHYPSAAEIKC
jgi:mediator of RNA polymerase II transcription subunit 5